MKPLYAVSIAEVHEDGDLYSSLFTGDTETVIKSVNDFFEEEKYEGHEVPESTFSTIQEMDGCNLTDQYQDRRYRITCSKVSFKPVHAAYIINDEDAIHEYMQIRDDKDKDLSVMKNYTDFTSFENKTFNTQDERDEFEKGIEAAGEDWCYVYDEDLDYFKKIFKDN